MKKVKQIKLIEQPKEDIRLSEQDEASLFGGYYCSGSYRDGGFFGGSDCTGHYISNGSCNGGANYCDKFTECNWNLA